MTPPAIETAMTRLRDVDVAKRLAPFAIAAALPYLLTLLFGPHVENASFAASGALTVMLAVSAFVIPWTSLSRPVQTIVPLSYFIVIFLLRDSSAIAATVYTPLVLLPVIWIALYGNRAQLMAAFVCLALTLIIPIVAFGSPSFPSSQWRRVAVWLSIAPIVGLTIQRLVSDIRDRAERLRTSEARFATAYAHAPIGMALVEPGGRFVSVNRSLCAITGYSESQLLALSPEAIAKPADRDRARRRMRALLTGEIDSFRIEQRFVHADGHPIDVAHHVALVRNAEGQPLHTIDQFVDITERKRRSAERERQLVLTRQARETLAEQNARLIELDRMKDEFVALVSHELRTPLTSITGYLEPLLDHEAGPLTATQERFLRTIDRNAHRLTSLVNDLLFLAAVDAGKLNLRVETVDLTEILEHAREAAEPFARSRGVALSLTLDGAPAVPGDQARLAQLVDNLVSNAIKFTPDGGQVSLIARADAEHATLEVRDSGIGVPADEVPHLFTRFFRTSGATDRGVPGTGLGLAIVKSIADAHHGRLEVQSVEGRGTTMRLLLPIEGPGEAPAHAAGRGSAQPEGARGAETTSGFHEYA